MLPICALFALTALLSTASASGKEDFPLVWVCLGITVVGVIIALWVAYRRPAELQLPGTTVMTAQECEPEDAAQKPQATYYNNNSDI